ncbi:hypothetical protein BDR26DRAFT_1008159 [Obelidium mucronatum]|nr:hypothetical protein BDR26DRAFT_1008159 [Obelidium mucronatum]
MTVVVTLLVALQALSVILSVNAAAIGCKAEKFHTCLGQANDKNHLCIEREEHLPQTELDRCACHTLKRLHQCYKVYCPSIMKNSLFEKEYNSQKGKCKSLEKSQSHFRRDPDAEEQMQQSAERRDGLDSLVNNVVKVVGNVASGNGAQAAVAAIAAVQSLAPDLINNVVKAVVVPAASNSSLPSTSDSINISSNSEAKTSASCPVNCTIDFYTSISTREPLKFIDLICSESVDSSSDTSSPLAICISHCDGGSNVSQSIAEMCSSSSTLLDALVKSVSGNRDKRENSASPTLTEAVAKRDEIIEGVVKKRDKQINGGGDSDPVQLLLLISFGIVLIYLF